MPKDFQEIQSSFEEDLSADLLKNMIQETFEDAGTPFTHSKSSMESIDLNEDPYLTIGTNIKEVLQSSWQTFFEIPLNVVFLKTSILKYSQISEFSKERSYFSLMTVESPNSVWIHHINHNLAVELASTINTHNDDRLSGILPESGANSSMYLLLAPLINSSLRNIFKKIIGQQIQKKITIRHLLSLGFHRNILIHDPFVIMQFSIENSDLSEIIQIGIPKKIIHNLSQMRIDS